MEAWSITKTKHAAGAFTGDGACRFGGRWNSIGTRVIYVGSSMSLAVLETLVQIPAGVPMHFSLFRISFDESLIEVFNPVDLSDDWKANPPPFSTKNLGDEWVRSRRSMAIAFPSSIVPEEVNYLLNPTHPDFSKIEIGPQQPYTFDQRLLDRSQ